MDAVDRVDPVVLEVDKADLVVVARAVVDRQPSDRCPPYPKSDGDEALRRTVRGRLPMRKSAPFSLAGLRAAMRAFRFSPSSR